MNGQEFIAALAKQIAALAEGADVPDVAKRVRELAGAAVGEQLAIEVGGKPLAKEKEVVLSEQIREVFGYWREATGKRRARLSPDRAQKIKARLVRDKFSVDELKAAVDGALASPWHSGEESGTPYLDIRTLFKSCEVVEGHIERAGGVIEVEVRRKDPAVEELKAQVEAAQASGDVALYNDLNKKLKKLLRGKDGTA